MTPAKDETYYNVLKVDPKASIPEIVAAFHRAKSAFASDSLATYSLMDGDETKAILKKLEEAYQVLTNVEKRAEYDRILYNRDSDSSSGSPTMSREPEIRNDAPLPSAVPPTETLTTVSGAGLKSIRENRGFSVDDVSRITKIPKKYLIAIESEALKSLPARVYLQGFLKNLASLYKLASDQMVKGYLELLDKDSTPKE